MRSRSASPEEQERKKLKSQKPTARSFVQFQNSTDRFVDLVWINYDGQGVKYCTVGPRQFVDVNTFVGHPWMFMDTKTGERLVAFGKDIYEPEKYQRNRLQMRKIVPIYIPVFSLKQGCLNKVRSLVKRCDIPSLEIPGTLITKLMSLQPERSWLRPP